MRRISSIKPNSSSFSFEPAMLDDFAEAKITVQKWQHQQSSSDASTSPVYHVICAGIDDELKYLTSVKEKKIWVHVCRHEGSVIAIALIDTVEAVAAATLAIDPCYKNRGLEDSFVRYLQRQAPNRSIKITVEEASQEACARLGCRSLSSGGMIKEHF